jgi:hypothetical protein
MTLDGGIYLPMGCAHKCDLPRLIVSPFRDFGPILKVMALFLRYAAVSAFFSAAAGFAIGAMPSQTIGIGFGEPMQPVRPTEAPSLELVKRKLEKKALTNTCTEWTILGGLLPENTRALKDPDGAT